MCEIKSKVQNMQTILKELESTKNQVVEVNHELRLQQTRQIKTIELLQMELEDLNSKNKTLLLELEKKNIVYEAPEK